MAGLDHKRRPYWVVVLVLVVVVEVQTMIFGEIIGIQLRDLVAEVVLILVLKDTQLHQVLHRFM